VVAVAQSLREQIAWACRILAHEGYADLTLGHVSGRVRGGRVLIKRKGVALDEVEPDDVVELDLDDDGAPLSPEMHLEAVLHAEVYRRRPDVAAVIHGHPPYATALAATAGELQLLTHDAVLFADGVALYDDAPDLVTDVEQGRAVAQALGQRRAVCLRNHGVLIADKDVPWAVLSAVTLERALRLQSIATTLGPLRPIAPGSARQMLGQKYQDRFVEEYWAAWIRRARRLGTDRGMPGS
jgi:L-fuculose-phosphate aldolase